MKPEQTIPDEAGYVDGLLNHLRPVGIVRSHVGDPDSMPQDGADSVIEIFPDFEPGLLRIEQNSHIMVIGWLHMAQGQQLQMRRPNTVVNPEVRGVFACRSPVRPNPIGVTTVRLLRVEGRNLHVKDLDMVDGTPVLDIKPHAAGFDGVFSARCAHDFLVNTKRGMLRQLQGMLREAESFHGEECAGIAVGARILEHAMACFGVAQKDPGLVIRAGADGCVADALQALTGATLGNGRLAISGTEEHFLSFGGKHLAFLPCFHATSAPAELLESPLDSLVIVQEFDGGAAGGRAARGSGSDKRRR